MKTESDYFLGGRNVSLPMVSFSLFATWFGAETCMGSSGAVYVSGLSGSRADPFGFSLCLLLMGLLLAGRLRRGNYITLADYFQERYGAIVEKLAIWIMIPSSLFWAAAQLRAFGQIISATTYLPVSLTIVLSTIFVVLYTYLGGLLGDIYTDFLQGIVIIFGLAFLLFLTLNNVHGLPEILTAMDHSRLSFIRPQETFLERIDRWMVPILGSLVTQEAIARILAAKSIRIARNASFIGFSIYLAVGSIPVFLGLIGPSLLPGVGDPEQFLIKFADQFLPQILFLIFVGALISAILSTIDSILLAISALFSHNLIFSLFSVRGQRSRVLIARLTVAASGILASFIATSGGGIYNLVLTASALGTAGVLVITMLGFYTKSGGRIAAIATLLTGLVLTLVGQYILNLQAPFMTSVLGSTAIFFIISAFSRKLPSLGGRSIN